MVHPMPGVSGPQDTSPAHNLASYSPAPAETSHSTARALMGWFSEQEAMQAQLGRMAGPLDNVVEVRQRWTAQTQAVAARAAYRATNPILEIKDQRTVETLRARPDIQAALAGLDWRPAMVNLKRVLSYQRSVNMEGLDERVAAARDNEALLFELCLPQKPSLSPSGVNVDADQKGFTVTSLNPNLRLAGANIGPAQVSLRPDIPPVPMLAISLYVAENTSYVLVVHFQNRYFLRDGYHRTAGLLRAGVSTVPCILVEARSLAEVGLQPGLFTPEVIFSERPPRLVDFWDDSVACDVPIAAVRKVVRIQGAEFAVPR